MTFAAMFADADDHEIEVDGRLLCQVWRDDLPAAARLRVTRISATTTPRQGLVLDADVDLSVAGQSSRRLVLWADSAPESLEIDVDGATEIRVWNVWSDGGMTHAWVGWSSIHVDTDDDVTTLTCTDGRARSGDDPTDLIVEIIRVTG